jgi:hypothetical protein
MKIRTLSSYVQAFEFSIPYGSVAMAYSLLDRRLLKAFFQFLQLRNCLFTHRQRLTAQQTQNILANLSPEPYRKQCAELHANSMATRPRCFVLTKVDCKS